MTFCDLFMKLICIMVFYMYRGELDKHFDGPFVVICWKVTILDPVMFNLPHNFGHKYTRVDKSLRAENYHKATIPKGLSHEFIIYRHRSLAKTQWDYKEFLVPIRLKSAPGPWTIYSGHKNVFEVHGFLCHRAGFCRDETTPLPRMDGKR